jgi:hypothetical protein
MRQSARMTQFPLTLLVIAVLAVILFFQMLRRP